MNVEKLIAAIKEEQTAIAFAAMRTPATDFPAYRQLVGRFAGLQTSLDFLVEQLGNEGE